MKDDFLNIKEQSVLYELKDYLSRLSVSATVMEVSEELPLNMLLATTEDNVPVQILYVPLPEDHFTEIRLLQLYSSVTYINPDKRNDLVLLLNELNNQSPMGTFAINEKGELGFKYILPVSRFEVPAEEPFQEVFNLFINCLTGLRNAALHVNSGELSVTDAIRDVMLG